MWKPVDRNSDVAADVSENPQVNVAFSNNKNSEWTSIAGSASVLFDRAKDLAARSGPGAALAGGAR